MLFGSPIHGLRKISAALKAGIAGLLMGRWEKATWALAVFVLGAVLWGDGGVLVQAATITYDTGQTLTGLLFTGGTSFTISGGTITVNGSILGGDGGILSISSATVTQGGSSSYTFGAGYNANSTTGNVNVGNGGVLNIGNGGAATYIGGGGSGSGVLTLSGSGILNIGAAGTGVSDKVYLTGSGGSGTVNLNGGILTTSRPITGTGASSTFNFDGGVLKVGSSFTANGALLSSIGHVYIKSGGIVDTSGIDVAISSPLEDYGSGGGFTKRGTGTLTLSGANTYTGVTTVSAGILKLGASSLAALRNNVAVDTGATLEVNLASQSTVLSSYTISGAGTVVKSGAGTWFVGDNGVHVNFNLSAGGLIDIQGGVIQANYNGTSFGTNQAGVKIASGATLDFFAEDGQLDALNGAGILQNDWGYGAHNVTLGVAGGSGVFSGVIKDGSARALALVVRKSGSGTQVFSGANTYTGATTVSGGALNIQNAAALGSTAGATTVSAGAALQIQGGIAVGAEALTLNGSGVSSDGALRNISGSNTYSGAITLGSVSRINSDSGELTLSGGVSGAYALTVGGAGNTT
ncbi:MAG: autotransporter-associated beta strand repeat-containing protein, partial [Verrucomicrobiota bacterium]